MPTRLNVIIGITPSGGLLKLAEARAIHLAPATGRNLLNPLISYASDIKLRIAGRTFSKFIEYAGMHHRTLILMRHAKSDWNNPGLPDHDRPLNQRGKRAAKRMGQYIEQLDVGIELVLGSTATRVQETLDLMRREWQDPVPKTISMRELYLASPNAILQQIGAIEDSIHNLLLIGHNPGLEDLVSELGETKIRLPTACLAIFRCSEKTWRQAAQQSRWVKGPIVRPADLD